MRAGVRAADIDSEARNYLHQNGLKDHLFTSDRSWNRLGNHEAPFIAEGGERFWKKIWSSPSNLEFTLKGLADTDIPIGSDYKRRL